MITINVTNNILIAILDNEGCHESPENFLLELEERLASGDITQEDVNTILQDQQRKSK